MNQGMTVTSKDAAIRVSSNLASAYQEIEALRRETAKAYKEVAELVAMVTAPKEQG